MGLQQRQRDGGSAIGESTEGVRGRQLKGRADGFSHTPYTGREWTSQLEFVSVNEEVNQFGGEGQMYELNS